MLRITRERMQMKMSQAALARRAEIHPTTISLIESGRMQPYPSQAEKLANALCWQGNPAELFEDDGDA